MKHNRYKSSRSIFNRQKYIRKYLNELHFQFKGQNLKLFVKPTTPTSPFYHFFQQITGTTTSVRISLVDSTVRNNLCHSSFDSNVKYESNNITASSSRPYHAGILIFWSTRTVIRKWSPCWPHKRDRWPAAEWKQYAAGWCGWRTYRDKIFEYTLKKALGLSV